MPELAILIVSWNVRDLLRDCLRAVYADLDAQRLDATVWVVDNASHDGSPEVVRAEFPATRLVESPQNMGFARGNNMGLQQMADTPPRYVMLLNPDTEVRPGALSTLLDFMDGHPRVGIAGAQLFYGDGSFQHGAFAFPGLWQILFDLYPMPSRLYETRLNGRYPRAWYRRGVPFPIDHPLGAAMLVRWAAIDQVGLLDEGFYMYCEEIDWCMRVKRRGWQIFCVPQAEVVHHAGQSTRQIRATSFANLWRSRHRLYGKHYSAGKRWLASWLVRVGMRYQKWQTQKQGRQRALEAQEVNAYMDAFDEVLQCFG